ncbi:MAG TPA: hypothetical protein DCQ06_05265 [Myxococcales bacterium]|nr:hypothetical protein [Myxococcales bacterium]HAN30987.1 hypothetical protein [Myxococcales bacterium]
MPGPQAAAFKNLAKVAFKAHNITLPMDWIQPIADPGGMHYINAFKLTELAVPTDPSKLFMAATPNKYHVDTVNSLHKSFDKYIDGICDAICKGWDMWRLQAKFSNLKVMGPSAIGTPGCLKGPALKNLIMMSAPQSTAMERKYSKSIATHISDAFKKWQDKVTVPGLPWYPAFAAFPGPQAPPMPNVPTPLIGCPSPMMTEVSVPTKLKDGMVKAHGDKKALHHKELFDAIAKGFAATFMTWVAAQQVSMVMGKGPIPTFAPPYVPVGPVMGGDNIAVPGHLAM